MPIIIPHDIPAYQTLRSENIFVMNEIRAERQDIRPIEIAILNLMPTKVETETQLFRMLSNSPLQIRITLIGTQSYVSTHAPEHHLERFYRTFDEIKDRSFDGMIITGAPVETMPFEEVGYWEELTRIFDYARTRVQSTIFICWGAQAALHYYYGLQKTELDKKVFGIFPNEKTSRYDPLLKGTDKYINIPHSRHTEISELELSRINDIVTLARSDEVGASILRSRDGRQVYFMGHLEYSKDTLAREYRRDLDRGLPIDPPKNYFTDDSLTEIEPNWYSTTSLIYSNWLNYYVYQVTPYNISLI